MNNFFGDAVYEFDHESGMHVQLIIKKGFRRKYAAIAVDFGSIDAEFLYNGEHVFVPDGTAHFLEHKMFEKPDGDIFNKYAAFGAQSNAFTTYSRTSYHFDCTDNFEQNIDILFELVFKPYFTRENVEKEKGIIIQEINMSLDDPYYISYMEMFKLLYKVSPAQKDIAGTEESVMSITPEILYKCYNAFYRPDNMCLTVVGDIDVETVKSALQRANLPKCDDSSVIRIKKDEPRELAGMRSVCKMETSVPLFRFGFKDMAQNYTGKDRLVRKTAGEIAAYLLFSTTSDLYDDLYRSGDVYYFCAGYILERDFGQFIIMGESDKVELVEEKVKKYISKIASEGIDKSIFETFKKAVYGMQVRSLDRPSTFRDEFGQFYLQGVDLFDYLDICGRITEKDVNDFIKDLLCTEMAVSIVEPKGGN